MISGIPFLELRLCALGCFLFIGLNTFKKRYIIKLNFLNYFILTGTFFIISILADTAGIFCSYYINISNFITKLLFSVSVTGSILTAYSFFLLCVKKFVPVFFNNRFNLILSFAPAFLLILLTAVSWKTGWLYNETDKTVYFNGNNSLLIVLFLFLYYLASIIIVCVFSYKNKLTTKEYHSYLYFPFFLIIPIIIQIYWISDLYVITSTIAFVYFYINILLEYNRKKINTQKSVIETFSSDFHSLLYVNLETQEVQAFGARGPQKEWIKYNATLGYTKMQTNFIQQFVFLEDKKRYSEQSSLEYIRQEIKEKDTFFINFRVDLGNRVIPYQIKIVADKFNSKVCNVLIGGHSIEEEKKTDDQRFIEEQIQSSLTDDYTSIFKINIKTNDFYPYFLDERTEIFIGKKLHSTISYTDAYACFVDNFVDREYKARMLEVGKPEYILSELSEKKNFSIIFLNERNIYCVAKFIKMGTKKEVDNVLICFSIKDDEIRENLKRLEIHNFQTSLLASMTNDYDFIIYTDKKTNKETVYKMSRRFKDLFANCIDFQDPKIRRKYIIENVIHPDDREKFISETDMNHINKIMQQHDAHFVNYRIIVNGKIYSYQTKYVNDKESGFKRGMIIGFHDIDG